LPGVPVKAIALALREQGLIVRSGNPKRIARIEDLTRSDVCFVNRQRGAGTRVLLDHHLDQLGISADLIRGYNQEEYTHLAVAASVVSGRADCGLGIAAAARALDLDFIPLFRERYDLVMRQEHAQSGLLSPLIALLGPGIFREQIMHLPGYDVSVMGKTILEDQ
jgi:putative molybdopterin biosynthesis protein